MTDPALRDLYDCPIDIDTRERLANIDQRLERTMLRGWVRATGTQERYQHDVVYKTALDSVVRVFAEAVRYGHVISFDEAVNLEKQAAHLREMLSSVPNFTSEQMERLLADFDKGAEQWPSS